MFPSHPIIFADLLQDHMSTSHTIRVHAQEVWDKLDKDQGLLSVRKKSGKPQSKSDLPLVPISSIPTKGE